VAVVALVLANGFFVATEFAIVAVRRSRIDQLAEAGSASAKAAQRVVHHLDAYIAACQLGITLASLGLGWIGEPAFARLIEPALRAVMGNFAPATAHAVAVAVAFSIITAMHIVIGELAPKGLAIQLAERTTLVVARPIHIFYVVFKLPITVLNAIGNAMLRLFGLTPATEQDMVHSVDELQFLVRGSERAGQIEDSEARIAARAFEFADSTAEDLMTPRTGLEGIPADIGRDELLAAIAAGTHTRLPMYGESLDDIIGVLHVRDLFRMLADPNAEIDPRKIVRPAVFVPEGKPADDLLDELRASGQQVAFVVDEYGGTAGMVTMEDLMQALVGPIRQEPGADSVTGYASQPERDADGSLLLDGLTRLREFEELSGVDIDEYEHEGVETLGGLVTTLLSRIPEPGDTAEVGDQVLRVEELDGHRVARVRLMPSGTEAPEAVLSG
jgi:CBS domain containing-hemolysin-like protein